MKQQDKLAQIIKIKFGNVKKSSNFENQEMEENFIIPSPEGDEDEQTFVSRCISELYDEYGQEQAAAICYSKWREE